MIVIIILFVFAYLAILYCVLDIVYNRLYNSVICWRVLVFYLEALKLLADHLALVVAFFYILLVWTIFFDNILQVKPQFIYLFYF